MFLFFSFFPKSLNLFKNAKFQYFNDSQMCCSFNEYLFFILCHNILRVMKKVEFLIVNLKLLKTCFVNF